MKRGGVDGGETGLSPAGSGLEGGVEYRSGLGLGGHSDGVVCRRRLAGLQFSMSRVFTGELSKSKAPFPVYILTSITDRLIRCRTMFSLWLYGRLRVTTLFICASSSRLQS